MALARFLVRHAALAMAVGVFAGLALPALAAWLHPAIPVFVIVILTTALLRLDGRLLRAYLRRPALPIAAMAWLLIGQPCLVWLGTHWLALPPALLLALLLNAVTPPLMGAPAMAMILGLDAELAAIVTFSLTLFFPLSLGLLLALMPVLAPAPLDQVLPMVLTLVGVPFALSFAGRRLAPPSVLDHWGPVFGATGVAALILIAIALMHGANLLLQSDARMALAPLLSSLLFNVVGQGLTLLLFLRLGAQRALCLGLMAGNRNLGLTLAATAAVGGPEFAAYVAFAQLPIYLTPMLLGRLMKLFRWRAGG